jgi:hypothetical protein
MSDKKLKTQDESGASSKKDKKVSSSRSNPKIRQIAESYAKATGKKLKHPEMTFDVDPKRGARIAKAYEEMVHNPNDPAVKKAYDALIDETKAQWDFIQKNAGLKVSKMAPDMENPYPAGSKDVVKDISENNHLWYYPTEQGYGSTEVQDHPLLKKVDVDGEEMPANDLFRIVHDYFGHAKEGEGFGPKGEENAWMTHKNMYSPEAQKALTSETRGQNSWVNFGPKGEENRANPSATTYAEQKAGLLPDWVLDEISETGTKKYAEGGEIPGEHLVHYSQHESPLETLDPTKHGSGRAGQELRRGKVIPRTYYYEAGSEPESVVADSAKHRYVVKRPKKIMDLASEEARPYLEKVRDINELEDLLHASGYHGYKNSAHPQLAHAVALFGAHKPVHHKPLKHYAEGDMVSAEPDLYNIPEQEPFRQPATEAMPEPAPTPMGEEQKPLATNITREYAPIWDVQSPTPNLVQAPHHEINERLRSGNYSFDKEADVPLIAPDGEVGTVKGTEVEKLLGEGFSYATPKDVANYKYGSGTQQAIAFAEGLGRGALSAPVFSGVERLFGVSPEGILGREESGHAGAAGEAVGFMAPLLLTGGAWAAEKLGAEAAGLGLSKAAATAAKAPFPKLLGAVGEAAEKGIAGAVGKTGLPVWLSHSPIQAARGVLEMGLYGAQHELSHYILGDSQTSDSILAGVGMSALMGGVLGGGLGLLGQGYRLGKGLIGLKPKGGMDLPDFMHNGRRPPSDGGGGGGGGGGIAPEAEGLATNITPEQLAEAGIEPPRWLTQEQAPAGALKMPEGYKPTAEQLNLFPEETQVAQPKDDFEAALDELGGGAQPVQKEEPKGLFSEQVQGGWVPPHLAEAVEAGDPIATAMVFPDEYLPQVFGSEVKGMNKGEMRKWFEKYLSRVGISEKPEAPSIRNAIERVTDGEIKAQNAPGDFLNNNKLYQLLSQAVEDTPAAIGSNVAKQKKLLYDKIDNKYLQLLGEHGGKSEVELGDAIRNSIHSPANAKYKTFKAPYKAADSILEQLPLTEAERSNLVSQVEKIIEKLKPSEDSTAKALREVIDEVQSPNVATVRDLRASMRNFATKAFDAGSFGSKNTALEEGYERGWRILKDFENGIGKNLPSDPRLSPQQQSYVSSIDPATGKNMWQAKLDADEQFGVFVKNLRFLSKKLGAKNSQTIDAPSMLKFISEVSPDTVFKKLSLGKINYNDMIKIAEDFKELANVIRSTEKIRILQKADKVHDIRELGTMSKELRKYTKEQKAFVFNSEADRQLLEDLILLSKNSPAHRNHSNTEILASINRAISQGAMLGGVPGIAAAVATQAKAGAVANMALKGMDRYMAKSTQRFTEAAPPGTFPNFTPNKGTTPKGKPKKYAEGGMVEADSPPIPQFNPRPTSQQAFISAVNQPPHIQEANRIVNAVVKGDRMITDSVKSVFNPKSTYKIAQANPKNVEKLKGYIDQIHKNPESLLGIGSEITPEFNTGYARAASTAAQFVKSLEPAKPQNLPFDTGGKTAPSTHNDIYNHVLKVTEQPLSVLHKIKEGTVIPEEINALKTIYPSLYERLQAQITEELVEAKTKKITIPYRTKIGLSALLGTPLDSTMTPQSIQAVQAMSKGSQQGQQGQGPATPQKGPHNLNPLDKLANMAKTPDQNRLQERSVK